MAAHNCLGYTLAQSGANRWAFGRQAEISVPVSGDLRANNGDALLAAAIAGQGIIYQPTFIVADDLRAGNLTALPLDQPTNERLAVHAIYLPDRHPPAKVRAFIDFIARRFAPEPCEERHLFLCQRKPEHTCAPSQGSEFLVGHTRSWRSSPRSRMCSRTT